MCDLRSDAESTEDDGEFHLLHSFTVVLHGAAVPIERVETLVFDNGLLQGRLRGEGRHSLRVSALEPVRGVRALFLCPLPICPLLHAFRASIPFRPVRSHTFPRSLPRASAPAPARARVGSDGKQHRASMRWCV